MHGKQPRQFDDDWRRWLILMKDFYSRTHQSGLLSMVMDSGYKIMRRVDLRQMKVLEIGPGSLQHMRYWTAMPEEYHSVDANADMLEIVERKLRDARFRHASHLCDLNRQTRLPFDDGQFDVLVSFYSMEHLDPLGLYLGEMKRVLKPGGLLAGAIPAEGGMAWGLGRYFTTRRWVVGEHGIDYDKVICWEHPNFADEILDELYSTMADEGVHFWPLRVPLVDVNLTISFLFRKAEVSTPRPVV